MKHNIEIIEINQALGQHFAEIRLFFLNNEVKLEEEINKMKLERNKIAMEAQGTNISKL